MANLPGLDTSQVGVISFWNAISQGEVASIDPKEAAVKAWFDSYNEYDNGLEGVKTIAYSFGIVTFNARIKDDGWIVVWFDRTNDYAKNQRYPQTERTHGYYDLLKDWTNMEDTIDTTQYYLAYMLNYLRSALSNAGAMTWVWADVGIYCYEFTSATTMTQAWEKDYAESCPTLNLIAGIKYTGGTTPYYHAVTGIPYASGGVDRVIRAGFVQTANLVSLNVAYNGARGVLDVIASGLMPLADTFYYDDIYAKSSGAGCGSANCRVKAAHLILWG